MATTATIWYLKTGKARRKPAIRATLTARGFNVEIGESDFCGGRLEEIGDAVEGDSRGGGLVGGEHCGGG